jgi:transglutaminase-like putative cysteine protease
VPHDGLPLRLRGRYRARRRRRIPRPHAPGGDPKIPPGSFYYNDNSDTGAVVGGLEPGDRYSITAVLPAQPAEGDLASLEPGTADLPPVAVVPDELAATLDRYVAGVTGSGARLVAMLDGLRRDGYVSHGVSADEPASRSGHAADRITELLTAQRMIGDQEQYAVTAALMARQLGFPARVVFGFAPEDVDPAGQTAVSGGDVSAWIEVDTTQYGWVAIDPTPPVRPIPDEEPEEPTEVARPQSPVQPQLPETDTRDTQLPPNASQDEEPAANPVLAAVADRAVFAPGEPDADQAEQLWKSVDELRYSLDYNLTRWERITAIVSLRSLGGYSVSGLFAREGPSKREGAKP